MSDDVQPVPAHITNLHELVAALAGGVPCGNPGKRRHLRTVYRTFVLSAASPVIPVLAQDLSREETIFVASGNSVVLCESQAQAQAAANSAASGLLNPEGTLLYVPPVPVVTQVSSGSQAITAGVGTFAATMPAGSTITRISVATIVGTSSTSTLVTVSGVAGGPYSFTYVSPSSGIAYWPDPTPPGGFPPASATAVPTVTFTGVANTGGGELNVFGTIPAGMAGVSARWPLRTSDVVWATAIAYPAMLAATITNRAAGY